MPDNVYENGINSFLQSDNLVLVNVGDKGALYYYDGSQLANYKNIPGDWSLTNSAYIDINASLNFNGKTLFGFSQVSGSPIMGGIYSIAGYDRNYPNVLNCEYLLSFGNADVTDIKIYAMTKISETVFLVAWSYTSGASVYWGVDKLDLTKTQSYVELTTRVINVDRGNHKIMNGFISYKSFPATGWFISASYSKDYSASFTDITLVKDEMRNLYYFKEPIEEANTVQIKLVLAQAGSLNTTPEIESIELRFE
jgi:hypothetical protein